MVRYIISFACCFFISFSSAVGLAAEQLPQKAFSVEDILKVGDIHTAGFSPDGRYLAFEKVRPFNEALGYGGGLYYRLGNSEVWIREVESGQMTQVLVPGADGISAGPWSPDGRKLVIYSFSAQEASPANRGVAIGIWDRKTGQYRELPGTPTHALSAHRQSAVLWADEENVIYNSLPPGVPALEDISSPNSIMRLVEKWREAWRGETASYSILESGAALVTPDRESGHLLLVNSRTGESRELAKGDFINLHLTHDGSALFALRNGPAFTGLHADRMADNGSDNVMRSLLLIDLEDRYPPRILSGPLNVFAYPASSVSLSPDGLTAAFYGVEVSKGWQEAKLWLYDVEAHKLKKANTGELKMHGLSRSGLHLYPSVNWLEKTPVILSETGLWRITADRDPVHLDLSDIDAPVKSLHQQGGRLLLVAGGDLWRLERKGKQLVSRKIYSDRSLKVEGISLQGPLAETADYLPVTVRDDDQTFQGLLAMATGDIREVPQAVREGHRTASSADMSHLVYVVADDQGKRMMVLDASSGEVQTILSINQHMQRIKFGEKKLIRYTLPDGRELKAWALLPPDYKPGVTYPVVVHLYGGLTYQDRPPSLLVDPQAYAYFYNVQLLTASGYVVLLPSLPIDYREDPLDIPGQLTRATLAAVDKLIDEGIADPDRLALMGFSYGGYSTLSVLTQTNRFKTGVAVAGVYNLTSTYGSIGPSARVHPFAQVHNWAGLVESGQGGMYGPPWLDPEKYIRNSPLFSADRINTPVLFLHGDLDGVPITQAEEMFNALYRQGKPARFIRFWGETHAFYSPANIRQSWHEMLRWLEDTMK